MEVTVLVKMVVTTVEIGEVARLEVGKVVGKIMTKVVKVKVIMEVMVGMNDGWWWWQWKGEGEGEMVVVVEGDSGADSSIPLGPGLLTPTFGPHESQRVVSSFC